jgi:hypothetical protein
MNHSGRMLTEIVFTCPVRLNDTKNDHAQPVRMLEPPMKEIFLYIYIYIAIQMMTTIGHIYKYKTF